jgi:hypothetical protein
VIWRRSVLYALFSWFAISQTVWGKGTSPGSGAELAATLHAISLDSEQTYRVRDLRIARGDLKLYLTEGVLSFFTPVGSRRIAAFFTTVGSDAGDAEVILLPPQTSERNSLAHFAKTPNLDEHFDSALFFFTDGSAAEVLQAIEREPVRHAPETVQTLQQRANGVGRSVASQLEVPLIKALLDKHSDEDGIFYGVIAGRRLGVFDVTYDPAQQESNSAGRVGPAPTDEFQLWTNFRSRHAVPFLAPAADVSRYAIEASIQADLSLHCAASFDVKSSAGDGRVFEFSLSPRLRINSATIDGKAVEVFQRSSARLAELGGGDAFLLVSAEPLGQDRQHHVTIDYAGTIVRRTKFGEYFVDDRTNWYPVKDPTSADFDLTFHLPDHLHLVSTGELLNESARNGTRTIHRKTAVAVPLAGFNLGEFDVHAERRGAYSIEVDAPILAQNLNISDPTLLNQTDRILEEYSRQWTPLAARSLAISPIAGSFGQGFPGLIYLSSVAYLKTEDRAAAYRTRRSDDFFSELLLPHEIAHQWWGNLVRQADYRSAWIEEAMANDAALQYIGRVNGLPARDEILETYRQDLEREQDGKTIESAGPVNFGERLISNYGFLTWQIVLYEKGSWILRMLRERLGDDNFQQMQRQLLRDYSTRPLTNEEFRQTASRFLPAGAPDRSLDEFFDTWVYGTGVPALRLETSGRAMTIEVDDVPDDFMVNIPLRCKGLGAHWVKLNAGDNRVMMPRGASSCELPTKQEMLYTTGKR